MGDSQPEKNSMPSHPSSLHLSWTRSRLGVLAQNSCCKLDFAKCKDEFIKRMQRFFAPEGLVKSLADFDVFGRRKRGELLRAALPTALPREPAPPEAWVGELWIPLDYRFCWERAALASALRRLTTEEPWREMLLQQGEPRRTRIRLVRFASAGV